MVVEALLTAALVLVHTLIAGITTRYFRIRMHTRWGRVLYTLAVVPVVLVASTLVVSGGLGVGVDLGSPAAALAVLVFGPAVLGATVDVLYLPPPEAVELPDRSDGGGSGAR